MTIRQSGPPHIGLARMIMGMLLILVLLVAAARFVPAWLNLPLDSEAIAFIGKIDANRAYPTGPFVSQPAFYNAARTPAFTLDLNLGCCSGLGSSKGYELANFLDKRGNLVPFLTLHRKWAIIRGSGIRCNYDDFQRFAISVRATSIQELP